MPAENPVVTETRSLESLIGSLSRTIRDSLGTGDRAELRRMRPEAPDTPAFWRLLGTVDAAARGPAGDGPARDRHEITWAAIIRSLAQLGDLHVRGRSLGRALSDAGVSEMRFLRLVRARGDALRTAVQQVGHQLATKREPTDASGFARLLLSDGAANEAEVRRHLARAYFSSQSKDRE